MASLLRRLVPLQTLVKNCRWKFNKSDDLLKHHAVQQHIKRVLDEYKCILTRLDREQVSESERRVLNHKLVEVSQVVNAFERTELAMREETDVRALIHSKLSLT